MVYTRREFTYIYALPLRHIAFPLLGESVYWDRPSLTATLPAFIRLLD